MAFLLKSQIVGMVDQASTKTSTGNTLSEYQNAQTTCNEAIVLAYESGAYSYQEIAEFFGLHFTTVGKIVRAAKLIKKSNI